MKLLPQSSMGEKGCYGECWSFLYPSLDYWLILIYGRNTRTVKNKYLK